MTATGHEKFYRQFVMPAFRLVGAETAHVLAVKAAKHCLVPLMKTEDKPSMASGLYSRSWGFLGSFVPEVSISDMIVFCRRLSFGDRSSRIRSGSQLVSTSTLKPWTGCSGWDSVLWKLDLWLLNLKTAMINPECSDFQKTKLLSIGCFFQTIFFPIVSRLQAGCEESLLFDLLHKSGLICRYGFNSDGHEVVYERLKNRQSCKLGEFVKCVSQVMSVFWIWNPRFCSESYFQKFLTQLVFCIHLPRLLWCRTLVAGRVIPDDRNMLNEQLWSPDRPTIRVRSSPGNEHQKAEVDPDVGYKPRNIKGIAGVLFCRDGNCWCEPGQEQDVTGRSGWLRARSQEVRRHRWLSGHQCVQPKHSWSASHARSSAVATARR